MAHGVLIVDDHVDFRRRIRQLLEVSGFDVAGEAADGAAGVRAAAELDPAVVLLDVHLPDALGFDLIEQFVSAAGDRRVILISTHDEDSYHQRARQSGASAFVTKDELTVDSIGDLLR